MAEPTDEQLKQYVERLPVVFKATLECFVPHSVIPGFGKIAHPRRAGAALTFDTIDERLRENYSHYRIGDTEDALDKLRVRGFVVEFEEPILNYKPTELGERLIAALTGEQPVPEELPELPELVWA